MDTIRLVIVTWSYLNKPMVPKQRRKKSNQIEKREKKYLDWKLINVEMISTQQHLSHVLNKTFDTHTHTNDLWVTLPDKCARRQPIKRYISLLSSDSPSSDLHLFYFFRHRCRCHCHWCCTKW